MGQGGACAGGAVVVVGLEEEGEEGVCEGSEVVFFFWEIGISVSINISI